MPPLRPCCQQAALELMESKLAHAWEEAQQATQRKELETEELRSRLLSQEATAAEKANREDARLQVRARVADRLALAERW